MEGFTKSNFPPMNWERNYELLRGDLPLLHQEISFSSPLSYFLHPENGLRFRAAGLKCKIFIYRTLSVGRPNSNSRIIIN
jgi:hypothetical protein